LTGIISLSSFKNMSYASFMLRGLQSDGNIQHPVDPVYRNNTVTPVYQVEETASDVSISGKIFIGMGFISFLMFILGGFQ